CLQSKNSTWTF
nr:immunoglobulin light chain junction region [Macaca mulatta]